MARRAKRRYQCAHCGESAHATSECGDGGQPTLRGWPEGRPWVSWAASDGAARVTEEPLDGGGVGGVAVPHSERPTDAASWFHILWSARGGDGHGESLRQALLRCVNTSAARIRSAHRSRGDGGSNRQEQSHSDRTREGSAGGRGSSGSGRDTSAWRDVQLTELEAYLGVAIHASVVRTVAADSQYWWSPSVRGVPHVDSAMPRVRFQAITTMLQQLQGYDHLANTATCAWSAAYTPPPVLHVSRLRAQAASLTCGRTGYCCAVRTTSGDAMAPAAIATWLRNTVSGGGATGAPGTGGGAASGTGSGGGAAFGTGSGGGATGAPGSGGGAASGTGSGGGASGDDRGAPAGSGDDRGAPAGSGDDRGAPVDSRDDRGALSGTAGTVVAICDTRMASVEDAWALHSAYSVDVIIGPLETVAVSRREAARTCFCDAQRAVCRIVAPPQSWRLGDTLMHTTSRSARIVCSAYRTAIEQAHVEIRTQVAPDDDTHVPLSFVLSLVDLTLHNAGILFNAARPTGTLPASAVDVCAAIAAALAGAGASTTTPPTAPGVTAAAVSAAAAAAAAKAAAAAATSNAVAAASSTAVAAPTKTALMASSPCTHVSEPLPFAVKSGKRGKQRARRVCVVCRALGVPNVPARCTTWCRQCQRAMHDRPLPAGKGQPEQTLQSCFMLYHADPHRFESQLAARSRRQPRRNTALSGAVSVVLGPFHADAPCG